MRKIRVGIIGAGAVAPHHLKVLALFEDVELVALASRTEERRTKAASEFPIGSTYEHYEEMAAKEQLDALYILVSADSIYRVTKACITYGKPLFIEKPPGLTVAETRDLADTAEHAGVPIMVGFNRRFYSVITQAKAHIEEKGPLLGLAVEAPESIERVKSLGKFSPELIDQWVTLNGTHGIDLLRFLGGEVHDLVAYTRAYRERNGDNFSASMTFEKRSLGQYRSHWNSPGRWQIDLYGDGVRAHIEPLEAGTVWYHDDTKLSLEPDRYDTEFKPGFWRQSRYFIDRVKDKAPITAPASSIADAVATMELLARLTRGS